jgi:tetratricopeptide (TPR) repeat protein
MDTVSDSDIQRYIEKVSKARDERRYRDVLDICADAEKENIFDPALLAAKSSAFKVLKRYREAQELLEKSLEEFPDDPYLHYNLASTYFAIGNRTGARAEASRVLELLEGVHPDEIDERPAFIKGGSLMLLRRISEAREFLEYEITRFPESPRLHAQLALAYGRSFHFFKTLKQVKRIFGDNYAYVRRRLTILTLSSIFVLVVGAGFIVISLLVHMSSQTNSFFFIIFLCIVAVLTIVIRPDLISNRLRRLLMPPDRSQRKTK